MSDVYLIPTPGTKWVISRPVDGRWINLHQDNSLFDAGDAREVLVALGLPTTEASLDRYFPILGSKGRCPTLELMELTNRLDPTNPFAQRKKGEVGV